MTRVSRQRGSTVGLLDYIGMAPVVSRPIIVGGGGGGGGNLQSSVTQNGVTFTFNKSVPVGQFANGDWWALPAAGDTDVTIISISPAITGTGATTQNGWMVNPQGNHPYDGRAAGFNANLQPALPAVVAPNNSVVKAVSLAAANGIGANTTYLDKAVILTILATTPPPDAFRPPYAGTTKTIWRTSSLLTNLLPSFAPVGPIPSLVNIEERFKNPQLDHCWITAPAGRPLPLSAFHQFGVPTTSHVYGESLAGDNCEAIVAMLCNNTTLAQKMNSLIYIVQMGIDHWGLANAGVIVANAGGGGHQGGRKIVTAFAGWLLNDASLKTVAGGANWGETAQFYWSNLVPSTHFVGQPAGMALFGLPNTFSKPFPYVNSGAKDIRDSGQQLVDGGLNVVGTAPNYTSASYSGLYKDIASNHAFWLSTICSLVPALRSIFNYDNEIFYADRLWDFGHWTVPDGSAVGRDLGTLVRGLHGQGNHGSFITTYGSSFINAMRSAYYTSTFTG